MYRFFALAVVFLFSLQLTAQVLPEEGSGLNYRIIGFSFPARAADGYTIEIATGSHTSQDSFTKHITITTQSPENRRAIEVPAFGRQYTWQVSYLRRKKTIRSPLYHFSTRLGASADTSKLRLRILEQAADHKDDYVALDGGGVLYDMAGNPVWYIPDTNGLNGNVADIKFTSWGTITFLHGRAYEVNYNGDILWQSPKYNNVSGDTAAEFYHHEFVRLANGHYMVLGLEKTMCRTVTENGVPRLLMSKSENRKSGYKPARFGTILEFDAAGHVVWSWKSSAYLPGSDYDYFTGGIDSNLKFDPHDNAFLFDEKNKCIYLGFRNLNRIMKIAYPGGQVLQTYGDVYKPGVPETGGGIFCNQHSIGRSLDGGLYVFNNNSCRNIDSLPSVVALKEPEGGMSELKRTWEYTCPAEAGRAKRYPGGGNAIELADSSMFICMGSDYSKVLIVSRDKKVLWSALPERFVNTDRKWVPMHQYRANIITRKQLEDLVWSTEQLKPLER